MSQQMAQIDETGKVTNIVVMPEGTESTSTLVSYLPDNPAFVGGDYVSGHFYPPQPYPSWVRIAGQWTSPVPKPSEPGPWMWDEESQSWYPEIMQ